MLKKYIIPLSLISILGNGFILYCLFTQHQLLTKWQDNLFFILLTFTMVLNVCSWIQWTEKD